MRSNFKRYLLINWIADQVERLFKKSVPVVLTAIRVVVGSHLTVRMLWLADDPFPLFLLLRRVVESVAVVYCLLSGRYVLDTDLEQG